MIRLVSGTIVALVAIAAVGRADFRSGPVDSAQPRAANAAASQPSRGALEAAFPSAQALTVHGDPPDPADVSDELKRVYKHIDDNFDAHLERLRKWVRIPNVSNTVEGQAGIWESAKFLRDLIVNDLGCSAEIHDPGLTEWGDPGNPVVYGRCDVGADRTVLDYIQADVMPVWPDEEWPAPPFGAQIIERPPFQQVMVGKGANNQKGKEMAQLAALISMKAVTRTLPVNVVFLADHDEERMEVGLRKFMFDHRELFSDVDVAFGYAGAQVADGRGEIVGQSVGAVVFDLETRGPPGDWLDEQPMWRHINMLTDVFAEDSPLIADLTRDVAPPSAEEAAYLRREAEMSGESLDELMKMRTRIRVTITGTWGGNMAPGFAGRYTPPVATSKIDIRFPPNVDGDELIAKVRADLDRKGYKDVTMKVVGVVPWSWANADNEMGDAIRKMYRQFRVPFNEPPQGNYLGAWSPYGPPYLFTRGPLQVPHLRGGLGYGWGSHYGPEFYVIKGDGQKIYGFAGAAKSYATVLYNFAAKNP